MTRSISEERNLDQITNLLLNGEITNEKADSLARAIQMRPKEKSRFPEKYRIVEEEGHLSLIDIEGCELACIDFYDNTDMCGEPIIFMNYGISKISGNGNFGALLRRLERIAIESKSRFIDLEVDEKNDHAIGVYEHHGFEIIGTVPNVSGDFERFLMRKTMYFD